MMPNNDSKSTVFRLRESICWLLMFVISTFGFVENRVTAEDSDHLPCRLEASHLPNLVQVHAKVISGGFPEGDAAFKELADLGIKTIISVDGMKPDLQTAKKYGLRYVHLPHGYDGVPKSRVKELAKAVLALEGTIYIHCHHGKHRSPAAASVACVAAGLVKPERAIEILELAGTNTNYVGLYQSARQARPLPMDELSHFSPEFPEVAKVPPMAEAMVDLGHTHEHIKLIAESNWRTPEKHPDLDPAHEALLLSEHFTELLRKPEVKTKSEEFKRMLRASESAARQLETLLSKWQTARRGQTLPAEIPAQAKIISDNCKACHVRFRDLPNEERKN